ncbi:MAG: HIT family protein [Gemmatimonadales bacterium]|nr:HIT family protein [Gemmatimonadales bacterium]
MTDHSRPSSDTARGAPARPPARWHDPASWAAARAGAGCPICARGAPRDVVLELDAGWLTMQEAAPMRGYACVVFRRHAVELHDLDAAEAAAFMRDVRRVSRAVAEATGAVKLNYEIHGNTLPHLHLHLFPRYAGDPFEGGPIDPRAITGPVYSPGEFVALRERVAAAVREGGGDTT